MHVLNQFIREGKFIENRVRFQQLSSQAKSLIRGLINRDVLKRLTI